MSSIPGNEYFDFENNGWRPGAATNWAQNHQINQETGELEGDYPLPPHEVARGYQAMHDRAVWNYRRRLMDQGRQQIGDATNFQKGALGLLQSYRAGGGAALEAGIYNQVAGGMRAEGAASFQQAQMTQPLDLMSDLRRHEGAIAARRADRANERMMIAAIVGNGSVSFGGAGAGGQQDTLGANESLSTGSNGTNASGENILSSTLAPEGGLGPNASAVAGQDDIQNPLQPGGPQPGGEQGGGQPIPGSGQGSPAGGQGVNTQVEPFGQQGGVGGAGAGGGANQPVPGGGAGGGVGAPTTPVAAMGAPGADGNFSTDAFAAASAAAGIGSPLGVMGRVDLNHFLVDMYESDPFYQSLPFAIQAEWRKRLGGAA